LSERDWFVAVTPAKSGYVNDEIEGTSWWGEIVISIFHLVLKKLTGAGHQRKAAKPLFLLGRKTLPE
jgi:hypothetical protein